MIFVDTGFLIALFEKRDSLHERAVRWAKAIRESMVITEYVIVEVADHFSQPWDRRKVPVIVRTVLDNPQYKVISASSGLLRAGIALHESRGDKLWSLTDCISFVVMDGMLSVGHWRMISTSCKQALRRC